jgi:DNA processing protein
VSRDAGAAADRRARALLTRIAEPDRELSQHVLDDGAVSAVKGLRDGTLKVKNALHWQARVAGARPERDLEAGRACGARFIVPGDDEWPSALDELAYLDDEYGSVPYGLWVRGDLDLRAAFARSVAIVGARASTAYGEFVAAEFALGAAERGWTVVSGGAYGIDGAAHRGAISGGGLTVAVLACGVDVAYPRGHSALIERVASAGLVISEWPPGCAPMRHRFLVRNRVIAALTAGTVVVEAASRSGSLSTANRARDLGRHVMSVPGPITSAMSAGANALLKQPWASCVTSAADVIELVGAIGDDLAPPLEVRHDPRDDLDAVARRVLDAVPVRTPVGPARIASAAGVELRQVTRALGGLAARGLVTRTDHGWRLPPRGAADGGR